MSLTNKGEPPTTGKIAERFNVLGTPNNGQALVWDSSINAFVFANNVGSVAFSDLTGQIANSQIPIREITANKLNQSGATDGQVLKWSNSNNQWEPEDSNGGSSLNTLQFIEEKVLSGNYFHEILDISDPTNICEFIVPNNKTAFLIEAKITMIANPTAVSSIGTITTSNDQVVASLQTNISATKKEFSRAKIGISASAQGSQSSRNGSGSGFGTQSESHFNVLGFSLEGDGTDLIQIENILDSGNAIAEFSGYLIDTP